MTSATVPPSHQAVVDAVWVHLGSNRAGLWLAGARVGVMDGVLVIQTPYESAKGALERGCRTELRNAAEHLTGQPAWRIELITSTPPVVNRPARSKELFA